MAKQASEKVKNLVRPVVEGLGYEMVGVEHLTGRDGGLLRVYIDSSAGISVDDCADVSRQLGAVLDVEDPIPGNYTLEVSSPGMDRPLFELTDYERFIGQSVSMRLRADVVGRKRFKGTIIGVEGEEITLELEDGQVSLLYGLVDSARLDPDI